MLNSSALQMLKMRAMTCGVTALLAMVTLLGCSNAPKAQAEEPKARDDAATSEGASRSADASNTPAEKAPEFPTFVPRQLNLTVGETLTYRAKWGIMSAGNATFSVAGREEHGGGECYRLESTVVTTGAARMAYKMKTKAQSWLDIKEGFSRGYELNENRPTLKLDVPGKVQDALSIVYYLRGCDLKLGGEPTEFTVAASRKVYKIRTDVLRREQVKVPALGKNVWALKVKPTSELKGDQKPKGEMILWLEENTLVPVQIVIDVPVITALTLSLIDVKKAPLK